MEQEESQGSPAKQASENTPGAADSTPHWKGKCAGVNPPVKPKHFIRFLTTT